VCGYGDFKRAELIKPAADKGDGLYRDWGALPSQGIYFAAHLSQHIWVGDTVEVGQCLPVGEGDAAHHAAVETKFSHVI
jgi:hypothetical protein